MSGDAITVGSRIFQDSEYARFLRMQALHEVVKNNMHQTNTYFCDEFLRAVYFHIKRAKKYLKKKFVSLCVFLGTLRFYNESFDISEESKVRK